MEKEILNDIVRRLQSGDQTAAGELYESTREDLYYYIKKTVNDPELAEDLLQDTYIEILQTINKLSAPEAYVTWSRQVAYHRCTAYFRRRHELLADENEDGQTVFDTLEEDREEFIPGEALEKEDLKKAIGAMIDQLPEEQRSALLLRYFDELPVAEIAKVQGVSEGTVKSRLAYGRKAIRTSVEDYEKKNGIRLHSVAILPLLLLYFREQTKAAGGSLTAKGGATAVAATQGAAQVGTPVAAEGAKAAATTAVKATGKTAAKLSLKQIFAGLAATTIAAASITTAAIVINKDPAGPTDPTVAPTYATQHDLPGKTPLDQTNNLVSVKLLTCITYLDEEGNPSHQISFKYDDVGNLLEYAAASCTYFYTYDENLRAVGGTCCHRSSSPDIDGTLFYTFSYTYDDEGRITEEIRYSPKTGLESVRYVYQYDGNTVNQYEIYEEKTTYSAGFVFDENGNLTEWLGSDQKTFCSYTYDGNNRCTQKQRGNTVYDHYYDASGFLLDSTVITYDEIELLISEEDAIALRKAQTYLRRKYSLRVSAVLRVDTSQSTPTSITSSVSFRADPERRRRGSRGISRVIRTATHPCGPSAALGTTSLIGAVLRAVEGNRPYI